MSPPQFLFTDRARPVIQMGRSERKGLGDAIWQEGKWGEARWNAVDWEVIWTDLECEVLEVTTETGRGGATDRFVPGTAEITASNVHGISDMIFPQVPETGEGIELVPQPPIEHEEDLQNPDADTIISNGWSFTDDFETRPPRWRFPSAWADSSLGIAPCGPFKIIDSAFEVELYYAADDSGYSGCCAAQWTQGFEANGNYGFEIVVTDFDWPSGTTGSPEFRVDLYLSMNTTNRECYVLRTRFVPVFGGANQVFYEFWHMGPDGSKIAGTTMPTPETIGTGTNGVFGTRTISVHLDQIYGSLGQLLNTIVNGSISGVATGVAWDTDVLLSGNRIGVWAYYVQGHVFSGFHGPRITLATGADSLGTDFEDTFNRPLGAGWVHPRWGNQNGWPMMQQIDGAMQPPQEFLDQWGGHYNAYGIAQWSSNFDGDQYVEVEMTNLSFAVPLHGPIPDRVIELYTMGNPHNPVCYVLNIAYSITYNDDENTIIWRLYRQGAAWQTNDLGEDAQGEIAVTSTPWGTFPEPQRWRLESDVVGVHRVYHGSKLLATVVDPNEIVGPRIGIYAQSGNTGPDWPEADPSKRRQGTLRIEGFSGGLQAPLGTEELGLWCRIGVHHQTLGTQWFFRGFVDELVPSYDPGDPDVVRITCIDSLGEAGKVEVDGDQMSNPFVAAPDRIRQILNQTAWPKHFRTIGDDSTIMSRPPSGTAVDALTTVAESCGGALYGDPTTGDIVFKGQDWQGEAAGGDTLAYITNYNTGAEFFGVPRVCPSGWERSSRRADMVTRVRYSTETSDTDDGAPIVREWKYPAAERLYGVEKYERTLICTTRERLDELGIRQLRLRQPNQFPRVEAVMLDASSAPECLDLMTTATFTIPSKYRCQHRGPDGFVFDRKMIVTGVRHTMSPDSWTCRLALDPSSAFYEVGGRWGSTEQPEGRWGDAEWGRTR